MKRRGARQDDEEAGREQGEHHREALLAKLRAQEAARREAPPSESAEAVGSQATDALEQPVTLSSPHDERSQRAHRRTHSHAR